MPFARRALVMWILVCTNVFSGAAMAGEVLDRITKSGKLVVATDEYYRPYSYRNIDGELDGFDVEVAVEIAKRLGDKLGSPVELEFKTPIWDAVISGFWDGAWDLSVGSMTPTRTRAEVLDFPAIYNYTPVVFVVHADFGGEKIEQLNGKVVGVCTNCTSQDYLTKSLAIDVADWPRVEYKVTASRILDYETDFDAFRDLKKGDGVKLDAVLAAKPSAEKAITDKGYPLVVLDEPAFFEPLALAIEKGDEKFGSLLGTIVQEMRQDGILAKLSKKWLGAYYVAPE